MKHEHELSSRTKYPIFFCRVKGRILTPTKPTKKNPKGGFSERTFKIETPIKFNNKGTEALTNKSYVLWEKYKPAATDTVIFDEIEKLDYMTYTLIPD